MKMLSLHAHFPTLISKFIKLFINNPVIIDISLIRKER